MSINIHSALSWLYGCIVRSGNDHVKGPQRPRYFITDIKHHPPSSFSINSSKQFLESPVCCIMVVAWPLLFLFCLGSLAQSAASGDCMTGTGLDYTGTLATTVTGKSLETWLTHSLTQSINHSLKGVRQTDQPVISESLFFPQIGIGIDSQSQLLYK